MREIQNFLMLDSKEVQTGRKAFAILLRPKKIRVMIWCVSNKCSIIFI